MDLIGPDVAQSYAGFGILAITNLALVAALIFVYRAKETQRKDADVVISQLQETRITEMKTVIAHVNDSGAVLSDLKLNIMNQGAILIDLKASVSAFMNSRGGRYGLDG